MLLKSYKKIPSPIGFIYQQTYSPFAQEFLGLDPDYLEDVKKFYLENKEKLSEVGLNFDAVFQAIDIELTQLNTNLDPRKLQTLVNDIEKIIYSINTEHHQHLTALLAALQTHQTTLFIAKSNCQYQNSLAITLLQLSFIFAAVLIIATSIAIFFLVPLVTAMVVSAVGTFLSGFLLELPVKLKIYDKLSQYARRKSTENSINKELQTVISASQEKINELSGDIKVIKKANKDATQRVTAIDVSAPTSDDPLYKHACLANHTLKTAKDEHKSLEIKSKYAQNMQYSGTLFMENFKKVEAKIKYLKQARENNSDEYKPWKSPLALGKV